MPRTEPVVREVVVGTPPASVWEALTEASLLSEWFEAEVEIDARPHGAVRFRFADGSELRGVIQEFERPRRLAFRWRDAAHGGDPTTVIFELRPAGHGTRVVVTETQGVLSADLSLEAAR